ncbi:MAG: radical SAM protein, partial [Desulfatitalea sp.]|nr:radical SAM protein [Desulfatitalea sp.]NNK00944.1 radical SAM protein [Desulfatitalea sp.]
AGIRTYVYVLFGTPVEDEAAARDTLNYVADHRASIDFLNVAIFNLPVGSLQAGGMALHDFYAGDLALYRDFEHPLGWGRRRVRHFVERVFKKHPAVQPIVRRDPPIFTANHAAFMQDSLNTVRFAP